MAWVDQTFPKADATIGLMQHQEIRLADAILKKSQQQDDYNDNPYDNAQDDVHALPPRKCFGNPKNCSLNYTHFENQIGQANHAIRQDLNSSSANLGKI